MAPVLWKDVSTLEGSPSRMRAGVLVLGKGFARGYPGSGGTSLQPHHWEPQRPPAVGSATPRCAPVPCTPSTLELPHASPREPCGVSLVLSSRCSLGLPSV